ncbi:response regulator transcription factor [Pyramidobacter sp. YE332]|uniref:response regulator transcription factor n=1 Tax=Pyramidobacter sp. YE332 TaxID=3068894 RepID=UPI00294AF49D|nr:response regulator transcription factor [Pyramidobacter sp. YE332]WOL39165.1 response regulator transcription factor [Pyramidobacter sp. YE332]
MIYYVEDDSGIRELVVYTLNQTGLEARGFAESQAFYAACAERKPDLILLDIMLPREDGLSVLKRIRQDASLKSVPTVMVTAKGSEYDKVRGLDLGADDYIAKPFGMMELVARAKARLRAAGGEKDASVLSYGALKLDSRRHEVTAGGRPVALTLKEFTLLELLMRHPGVAFTREQLLERNWDYSYEGGTRTVDVHIQTLRGKLGDCAALIQTVRGVGYKLGG